MVLTSSYISGSEQADGRRHIKETHTASDGQEIVYEYLADAAVDPAMVLDERAKIVLARLNQREAALLLVVGTEVPMTRFQFLDRFTPAERMAARARAKNDPIADDFMKMLETSGAVFLSLARPGLDYLASLGDITPERAAAIGAEQ